MDRSKFEEYYIKARDLEGRIHSDEELKLLPNISRRNRHSSEWRYRRNSAFLVFEYLEKKKGNSLLDLGCGNGWMTNYFAELFDNSLGIDVNNQEIEQAKRVFSRSNLDFKCCDIFQTKDLGTINTLAVL